MNDIFIPVVTLTGLGLTFGMGLAFVLRIFGIEADERVALIISRLPGANCGACGKAGCAGFAEALVKGEAVPAACVVSNEESRRSIAELLGLQYETRVKTVAFCFCNGGTKAEDKYRYRGVNDCRISALLFGGLKECDYGCMGLGTCAEICPFGAIAMAENALPVVDKDKCTGCGNCLKACPKSLFSLVPHDSMYHVKCSSKDPGRVVTRVCKSGCIGCKKCEGACPLGAPKVTDFLARIDYAKCKNIGKCLEACPTKVIARDSQVKV